MILSFQHNFLYIRIPCTGSNSMKFQLLPYLTKTDIQDNRSGQPSHRDIHTIQSWLKEDIWDNLFRFVVVRNPYDYIVSFYYMMQHYNHITEHTTFEQYLEKIGKHWNTLYWKQITTQDQQQILVDWYKYETGLDTVIKSISTKINQYSSTFPIMERMDYQLDTQRRKDTRHYREIHTTKTRNIIERLAKKELEYFEYEW